MILFFVSPDFSITKAQNGSGAFSDSLLTLCKKNFNEGLYRAAVDLYKDAYIHKLSPEELFYFGLSYNNLRETVKASRYFQKAVETAPEHKGYRIQLARNYSQLGKTFEAIGSYQTVIDSDSNNVTAYYELGLIYYDIKDYDNAVKMFSRNVTLNKNDFLSSYYLGSSMMLSPNPNLAEPAMKHLEHSVALNPEYVPSVALLASSKFNIQKYYDANALYGIAIRLRPKNAEFYFKSGLCNEKLKFYIEAVEKYTRAIELNPNDPNYYDHLGFVYFNLNKYDSALSAYKRAILIDDNPTYFLNLGFTYAKMDSLKKTIESFQKALSLMALDKIGNICNQIGAVYYRQKNYKEAKLSYEKALMYYPDNIDAQFYIAMINEKLMDWKNARLAYQKVIKMAKDDSLQTERLDYSSKKIQELKKK